MLREARKIEQALNRKRFVSISEWLHYHLFFKCNSHEVGKKSRLLTAA